jgi:hypothetical protein
LAATISSALYVFAPYHILDVFVRTAYPESVALAFAPGLFYSLERYFATGKRYYLGFLALFFAAVFVSHPPTLIMFAFPFGAYFFYLLFNDYKNGLKEKIILKRTGFTILGLALGAGLSAFFVIPAFLQQNLVNSGSLNAGYLDFHNHFVCLLQLIWSSWGFGTSIQGCQDNVSFQLGIVNWLILIGSISIISVFFYFKKQNKNSLQTLLWIIIAFFGMYMTLSYSQPFWEGVPYVSFLQFPWRFLSVAIFAIAVLGGLVFTYIKDRKQQLGLFVLLIVAIPALTFSFLRPATYLQKEYFAQDSPDFYKGLTQVQQNDTAELGYMPKYAKVLPDPQTVSTLEIKTLDTDAKIAIVKNTFVDKEYVVIVPKKTRAVLYVHFFPGWKFSVNGSEVNPDYSNIYGFPYINLPSGQSQVKAWFTNTPIVTIANLITLLSFIILILLILTSFGKVSLKSELPTNREEI